MSAQNMQSLASTVTEEVGLLDQIVEQSKVAKSSVEHARAKVSGKPAALYPGSVGVGTISSMFNTMEIGHGWDGRKTIT